MMPDCVDAFIALGSNLDHPRHHVMQAIATLEQLPQSQLLARSSLYLTPPWGVTDQPPFVNAVVHLKTAMLPHDLLQALQHMEQCHGRHRDTRRWGPRPLDLDILMYGQEQCSDALLTLPHPRMTERAFVLVPLADITLDTCIPGKGRVRDCLARVDTQGCQRLPETEGTAVSA